jgi:hypothetical protein
MRVCIVAALLLAACGGGQAEEESAPVTVTQTYRNCRYEFVPGGLTPALYTYRCWIVGQCDNSDLCTNPFVQPFHPECVAGRTTCTACPLDHAFC